MDAALSVQYYCVKCVNVHVYTLNSSLPEFVPHSFSEARRISGRLPATVCKRIGASVCVCVWIWKVVIITGFWPVYELFYCMNCVEGNLTGQLNNTTQKKLYFLVFKLDIISHFYIPARSPIHLCFFFQHFLGWRWIYTLLLKSLESVRFVWWN